jgi:GMP synthase-like glutamine amidotransferase
MSKALRIAIMDAVPKIYWGHDEGITDAEKFHDLLQPLNPEAQIDVYYASEHEFPGSVDDYDGYMLTGSPSSVNDGFDWIDRLSDLIVAAESKNKRIVASCFGHQLVARTFGGSVGYNESGWVIGNYQLNILHEYEWMQPHVSTTALYHFNKERVTRLPDGAVSFAHSDEYEDYAYTLGDNIMCMQGHPEQPSRAMNNFLESVRPEMSADELKLARKMIDNGEPDADIWGRWMMRFFQS